eukprot:11228905-Prorocentrum_lima.AAC.1
MIYFGMNCYDQESVQLRGQLHVRISWLISPPCSGISELASTIRTKSGELGWFLETTREETIKKHG